MALINHWDFQETSGTAVADSVGSNNGSADGTVNFGQSGPGGSLPYAASLTGLSNNPIDLASDIHLLSTNDWSIAFWAKQNADDTHGMIVGDITNTKSFVRLAASGFPFRDIAGTTTTFTVDATVRLALSHYFLTYDASTQLLSLYINGVLHATDTRSSDLLINTIGNAYTGTTYTLTGLISDLRIYDHVPTQAEIEAVVYLGTTLLSITSITDDQFFQRPSNGELSVVVAGSSSTDEIIEYQIDSGTWQTLATAASGAFSGSVSVATGNKTLRVRLSSENSITSEVAIQVGDVFGWFGQSNPDGRFTNSQPYTGSLGYRIYDENNTWIAGASGYTSPGASGFSPLPRLASLIEASSGVPVAFICETLGSTGFATGEWDSSPAGTQYNAAVAAITDSGINGLRAALFDFGENSAAHGPVTAANLQAQIEELHTNMQAAVGFNFPFVFTQTGTTPGATSAEDLDAVRQGQQAAVDNNADIHFGVISYDRANLHWNTDAEAVTYAGRYAAAIEEAFFGGSVGVPPRVISAVVADTTVTLTFDRDLETATNYTADAWAFDDFGSAIAVTAASKTGTRIVDLTLATAPTSTGLTVSLGAGDSAAGASVPRGPGTQPALPLPIAATVDVDAPVWELMNVKQIRRTISIS